MIHFGMPALLEKPTVPEAVALCDRLGLSFLELNTNFPQHQIHLLDQEKLNCLAQDSGIFYTIHVNDEMAVASFDPLVAEGYCASMLKTLSFAQKIGARTVNMHLSEGGKYTTPSKVLYFYEAFQKEYMAGMIRFRDLCTEAVGTGGLRICVENTTGYRPYQKQVLEMLLESPVFGLTLDVGHNFCSGGLDEPWILDHKDRLHHLHIHDVLHGCQDHQPLGTGALDIPQYLRLAEDCGATVVLETKTEAGLRRSVEWVKNKTGKE